MTKKKTYTPFIPKIEPCHLCGKQAVVNCGFCHKPICWDCKASASMKDAGAIACFYVCRDEAKCISIPQGVQV